MLLRRIAPIESAPLELADLPIPEPGPGEVRIRVRCCAICRTDLHVIEGDLPQEKMPIIPGHQIVGTSTSSARRLRLRKPTPRRSQLGQRVGVAWLRHTCGCCGFCTGGKENLCESARFTGYHADGGYAEYAVAPAAYCYDLARGLQRRRGRAAVVFRHHRLSGAAALQSPARRPAGALRVRLVGARGDPDCDPPRLRGLRRHARREPPRVGPPDGRGLGRRRRRANAGQGR